jgi:hypothetical protein
MSVLWVAYATHSTLKQIPDAVDTVVCASDDGWKYHPKHVEQFPDINKLSIVASCWIYKYVGMLLGAHTILHISRIRVKHWAHSSAMNLEVAEATETFMPFYKITLYSSTQGRAQ